MSGNTKRPLRYNSVQLRKRPTSQTREAADRFPQKTFASGVSTITPVNLRERPNPNEPKGQVAAPRETTEPQVQGTAQGTPQWFDNVEKPKEPIGKDEAKDEAEIITTTADTWTSTPATTTTATPIEISTISTTVQGEPVAPAKKDIIRMNKGELITYAKELGITVMPKWKVKDLRDAIKTNLEG